MTEGTSAPITTDAAAAAGAGTGAASSSSGGPTPAEAPKALAAEPSRGVDLVTSSEGEVLGFSISPIAQVYSMLDKLVAMRRVVALPIAERYALAGKVASVQTEHARIAERLASAVATTQHEGGALNALYVLEACKDLVPGFKEHITQDRLQKAAEMSLHQRVQAFVLLGQKPAEWEKADTAAAPAQLVLLPQDEDEEDDGIVSTAGRAVGDATKFVGGAALGGVGLVTDTLGLTDDAEGALADTAEDAVDMVGDGVNAVVDTLDVGLDGTADDFAEKGVVGAVGDGVADAVDMVSDFVGDAVHGIADGVHGMLNFVTGQDDGKQSGSTFATHKLVVVVGELFGQERSLGLRLENRVVTKFTLPEAEKLGFRLGDTILGVGKGLVNSQEDMLAAIGASKEALKSSGAPIHFLVERLGAPPAAVRAAQAQRAAATAAAGR